MATREELQRILEEAERQSAPSNYQDDGAAFNSALAGRSVVSQMSGQMAQGAYGEVTRLSSGAVFRATARSSVGLASGVEGAAAGTTASSAGGRVLGSVMRVGGPALVAGITAWDASEHYGKGQYKDTWGSVGGGVGAVAGGAAFAAGGAAIGTFIFPGIGTAAGGAIGFVCGAVGGYLGYLGGSEATKAAAGAAGVENTYTDIVEYEKLVENYTKALETAPEFEDFRASFRQERGREPTKEEYKKLVEESIIPELQDRGVGVTQGGELMANRYTDFNREPTLAGLRENMQTLSAKTGPLPAERFEQYKAQLSEQVEAVIASGGYKGMRNPDGTLMSAEAFRREMMGAIDKANYVGAGESREQILAAPLQKVTTFLENGPQGGAPRIRQHEDGSVTIGSAIGANEAPAPVQENIYQVVLAGLTDIFSGSTQSAGSGGTPARQTRQETRQV